MKNLSLIFILFSIFSCQKEIKKNDDRDIMEYYKIKAIKNGDETAYGSYLEYAENNNIYLEKLSLSLIMNHKYKTLLSYKYIFNNLIELENNNKYKVEYLKNLDEIDKNYALYYLMEGAKKNDISCQTTLEKIYRNGIGIKKNQNKSDSLYLILENDSSLKDFYKRNKKDKSKIDRTIR